MIERGQHTLIFSDASGHPDMAAFEFAMSVAADAPLFGNGPMLDLAGNVAWQSLTDDDAELFLLRVNQWRRHRDTKIVHRVTTFVEDRGSPSINDPFSKLKPVLIVTDFSQVSVPYEASSYDERRTWLERGRALATDLDCAVVTVLRCQNTFSDKQDPTHGAAEFTDSVWRLDENDSRLHNSPMTFSLVQERSAANHLYFFPTVSKVRHPLVENVYD